MCLLSSFPISSVDLRSLDQGLDVSFSRVKYRQVAPLVGLDPARRLLDIETFELHRSRIPTDLFKSIIEDMDLMLLQYGSPSQHSTEEATSRFLSPVKMTQSFFALESSPLSPTDLQPLSRRVWFRLQKPT